MIKKLLLLLFLCFSLNGLAAQTEQYVYIYLANGAVDSIAAQNVYDIHHSRTDIYGKEHTDYVTLVLKTLSGDKVYPLIDVQRVVTPNLWHTITLNGGMMPKDEVKRQRRISIHGGFPGASNLRFQWEPIDSIAIHMGKQDTVYNAKIFDQDADSVYAYFKFNAKGIASPMTVYYSNNTEPKNYNQVRILAEQNQPEVDDSKHLGSSGDCASAEATLAKDNQYNFVLNHWPAYFVFLTHNKRLPSVKLKKITMIADKPIAGTFNYSDPSDNADKKGGIDLNSVKDDASNTITLRTPYFYKGSHRHLPREYKNSQDSTAAYMVVAPQTDLKFYLRFEVEDTLSRIDTVFVQHYHVSALKANHIYTINAEIPDTLFSIVDLGLGDIKYAYRNVESFFERGPVKYYGGAFSYGESATKNSYDPGYRLNNYHGGSVQDEFTANYDAAYQRWGGCWRMIQNLEADSLLKKCTAEWREYNGVYGALVTGPSGKRIFLPANDKFARYWTIDRSKKITDYYWIDDWGGYHFYDIPCIGIRKTGTAAFQDSTYFYQGGFCRPVIEYSNEIKSGVDFDHTLMLLRHESEKENALGSAGDFTINGIIRNARPWPTAATILTATETGFIFGTDSTALHMDDKDITTATWDSTYFFTQGNEQAKENLANGKLQMKLVASSSPVSVNPYGQQPVSANISAKYFTAYIDKTKKYFVREYAVVGGKTYYASNASAVSGFFAHTDRPDWEVNDATATLRGHLTGVSSNVIGQPGFVVSDSVYDKPNRTNGQFYICPKSNDAPYGYNSDLTFSYPGFKGLDGKGLDREKYYFIRAVLFVVKKEEKNGKAVSDTTFYYAPEVKIFHPLDTLDLGLSFKIANENVGSQYPEDRDSTYIWNNSKKKVPTIITDIAGTEHDITYRKWHGADGWTFGMPTDDQLQAIIDSCTFKAETRFGQNVLKVTGPNSGYFYIPAYESDQGWYSTIWTGRRPDGNKSVAYAGTLSTGGSTPKVTVDTLRKYWVRPVLLTNRYLADGSQLFVSTDTAGVSENHSQIQLWGRILGITPTMKKQKTCVRGFVLLPDAKKYGTLEDADESTAFNIHTASTDTQLNGLYEDSIPAEVRSKLDGNKNYWYRAYIKIGDEVRYGDPKLIQPLTVSVADIDWEVHGNSATLHSKVTGVVFIKDISKAKTGFVVGKTADVSLDTDKSPLYYTFADGKTLEDGNYACTMSVAKDTVYWVRAFIESDGGVRYSAARQFGLDYVDLGLPSHTLWANISVGAAYPEDDVEYFSRGETAPKKHYVAESYIDDEKRTTEDPLYDDKLTTLNDSVILMTLKVPNSGNTKTYEVPYRGAVLEFYPGHNYIEPTSQEQPNNHISWCHDPAIWKRYSGTKNDAAYINWENDNPKFKNNNDKKYIDNSKYGDLFVEPSVSEWRELRDNCNWAVKSVNGVRGYEVTSKANGNSIFLPFKGFRYDRENGRNVYQDTLRADGVNGHYPVADSVLCVSVAEGHAFKTDRDFDAPDDDYYYISDWRLSLGATDGFLPFYGGFPVRPVARFNKQLTNDQKKLADNTLVYLATDTVTYLNYRTAVMLQGTYRINKPLTAGSYELGFVVGTATNPTVDKTDGFSAKATLRNGSQYFLVADKNNNLKSDQLYYYRFYLKAGDQYYYGEADTFRLAKPVTGKADWQMYDNKATLHGTVQGVMPDEAASSYKAGIIVGYDRDLTYDRALNTDTRETYSSSTSDKNGPVKIDFTLTKDTTYYFRTYQYYNGKYHYGLVNAFGCEFVDLGLPSGLLWASTNVGGYNANTGANHPGVGLWYGVDEDDGKVTIFGRGSGGPGDPAHNEWHGVNRMPSHWEYKELAENCTWTPDTLYGCPGWRLTSKKNGKTIFFRRHIPKGGYHYKISNSMAGDPGGYYFDKKLVWTEYDYFEPWNLTKEKQSSSNIYDIVYQNRLTQALGCYGIDYERPIEKHHAVLPNGDKLWLSADSMFTSKNVSEFTFFGSVLGLTQQHLGGQKYTVEKFDHVGFVIGTDTLTTHEKHFKYDIPMTEVKNDSVLFYTQQNVNLFKPDSTYWIRVYALIGGQYYYGNAVRFVRQPQVTTGNVEWAVGRQKAILHGSVKGFNANVVLDANDDKDKDEVTNMSELSKKAKFGFLVGWKDKLEAKDTANVKANVKMYTLGQAVNGDYAITVPYDQDTTYYYRAFVMYPTDKGGQRYIYGPYTNHYGLEFVDLGLPMQWANISYGGRFAEDVDSTAQVAWGDTEAYAPYTFNNYRYYFSTGDTEYDLGNEIKATPHDVAHAKWNYTWDEKETGGRGQLWSMPSADDLQMLVDSCVWTDSTGVGMNGKTVQGYKVTGPSGKSIFLPNISCTVWAINGSAEYWPEYGPLWTSSRAPYERNAYGMLVGSGNRLQKYHYRYHGHFVRPMATMNIKLSSGKRLGLSTERTSWTAGAGSATIYGTVLGLDSLSKITCGFEIAKTADMKDAESHACTATAANGLFQYTIPKIDNTRMYYYRTYLSVDGKKYYGKVRNFGIEMVDLGLPSGTKWANVNMGAWKDSEHGNFYSWGETVDKDVYDSISYKYFNTKKNSYEHIGTNIAGNDSTDVAQSALGGLWRMPTDAEWKELIEQCTWKKDTINHVVGFLVTSKKNKNSIFLPTNYYGNGDRDANFYQSTNESAESNHDDESTSLAYYWSATRAGEYRKAREVKFNVKNDATATQEDNYRWRGNAIRPVASTNAGEAWLKTTGNDWTYGLPTDSMHVYATLLNRPQGYRTFFLIGTTPDLSTTTSTNIADVQARTLTQHNSICYATLKDYLKDGKLKKDGVYYYRAYTCKYDESSNTKSDIHLSAESHQFGLTSVNLGSMTWANINVGATSPEEMGLNGSDAVSDVDLAQKYYGGSWRLPTEAEKQALLTSCTWTEYTLYGVKGWKVANKSDDSKWIFLATKDPSTWGLRAVMNTNVTIDGNAAFLRTDRGGWRAGYGKAQMKATLIGGNDASITEKGFLLATTNDPTESTAGVQTVKATATTATSFSAPLPDLALGTTYYRAYVKTANGYTYAPASVAVGISLVDLGLPSGLQWSDMNIGSADNNDDGYAYAWADTTAATTFSKDSYRYGSQDLGTDISSNEQYDVAAKLLGVVRMPGKDDFQELIDNCSFTPSYDSSNKLLGYTVKNKDGNGESIFLPVGNYWSSTAVTGSTDNAYKFQNNSSSYSVSSTNRWNGFHVRPVGAVISTLMPKDVKTTTATLRGAVYLDSYTSTTVGFELSDTVSMANATKKTVSVSSNGAYELTVDGLNDGTPYYYRAYYTSGDKTVYGVVKRFVTTSAEGEPKAIDLGLSVKWGDRNVNAKMPELSGDKYGWGEVVTRPNYTTVTYSYNKNNQYLNIGTNISATAYDVALKKYGGCWHMPTSDEMDELLTKCSWTWGTKEGVSGYWVENNSKRNTRSIFIPVTGYVDGTETIGSDGCYYWTSTATNATNGYATYLYASKGYSPALKTGVRRYAGLVIRPVYESNTTLGGKDYLIRTDSVSHTDATHPTTLYGTMLGMTSGDTAPTEGFVIGTAKGVTTTDATLTLNQTAEGNGIYAQTLTDEQMKTLSVGQTYYVRAYVTLGSETRYGDAVTMTGNTFLTDSATWTLGNKGTFYGSVKAAKADGLEVGFYYSDNAKMENAKSVTAAFLTTGNTDVFTASIDTVHLQTYYVQAYTKLNGTVYTTNIISFGAHAVDLGLPSGVQWTDMNLGTNSEQQTGDKYKWSELTPNTENFTPSQDAAIGGMTSDVAHRRLGTKYRMPSWDNLQELVNPKYTTWTWEVNGYRVTSKTNGNSIFIPAGTYWGSILDANNGLKAHALRVDATGYYADDEEERTEQLLIRGVLNTKADVIKGADAGSGTIGGGVEGNE